MKKLVVILGVIAMVFAFSSCKKDCVCSASYDDITVSKTYTKLTKKECKDKENELNEDVDAADYKVTCKH